MTVELMLNAAAGVTAWLAAAVVVVLLLRRRTAAFRRTICRAALAGVPVILAGAAATHFARPADGFLLLPPRGGGTTLRVVDARPSGAEPRTLPPGQPSAQPVPGEPSDSASWGADLPWAGDGGQEDWAAPVPLAMAEPTVADERSRPVPGGARAPSSTSLLVAGSWRIAVVSGVVSISLAWLAGLGIRLLRLAWWRRTWRKAAPAWLSLTRRLAGRVGLNRPFAVYVARGLAQPAAAGLLRPAIILPDRSPDALGPHLRGALAHELGHLRGRDPLWCVLGCVATALAWWCPAAWYLQRRERIESELTADDFALDSGVRPRDLANTLARFAEWQLGPMPVGVSGIGCHLTRRIEMILNATVPHGTRVSRKWRWLLGLGACVAALAVISTPLVGVARGEDELNKPPEVKKEQPKGEDAGRKEEPRKEEGRGEGGERPREGKEGVKRAERPRGEDAERGEGEVRRERPREGGEGERADWARRDGVPREIAEMARTLKITEEQEKALKEMLAASEEAVRNWRRENEARFREAEEAIRKAQRTMEALRGEQAKVAASGDDKLLAVFTPQQRALWETQKIPRKYTQMTGAENNPMPQLTNRQLDDIDILCEKAAKELVELASKPPADRDKAHQEILTGLDKKIFEDVLTPEQREVAGKFLRVRRDLPRRDGEGRREGGEGEIRREKPKEEGRGEGEVRRDRPREDGGERKILQEGRREGDRE